jgi:hypothetical protein
LFSKAPKLHASSLALGTSASGHALTGKHEAFRSQHMNLPSHNPIMNAKRFRLFALENLERARSAASVPERRHHRTLARHYMFMIESELEAASKQAPWR